MKKKIVLPLAIFCIVIAAGAVALNRTASKAASSSIAKPVIVPMSKIKIVSESPQIPQFVSTYMANSRQKIAEFSIDSNSTDARLIRLGFNAKTKRTFDQHTAISLVTLHKVYDKIYPTKQFITFGCLSELLKKYDLSLGFSNAFIHDIPADAIDSMEKFKPSYMYSRSFNYQMQDDTEFENLAVINEGYGDLNGYISDVYDWITEGNGKLGPEKNLIKYSVMDMKKRKATTIFMVVAPKEYFTGAANAQGIYGTNTTKRDPLVLAPVEGGYIVVCSW